MAPKIRENEDARRTLLEEGARTYLDATTAIITFEREVQKQCREILIGHLDDYIDALQVAEGLDANEIRDHVGPKAGEYDGVWRAVGVAIEGKRFEPHISWWGTYCTLYWEDQMCYASVGDWIGGPRIKSDQVFQKFRKLTDEVYQNGKDVSLYHALTQAEAGSLEESLDLLLQQWIELWKKVGGVKGVFQP